MRGANLWKRILNEGALVDDGCNHPDPDALMMHIISAPIIVSGDVVDLEDRSALPKWDQYTNVCLPFPECWIEGSVVADGKESIWGAMCVGEESGRSFDAMLFQGSGNHRPTMEGSLYCTLDPNGNIVLGDKGFSASYASWLIKDFGFEKAQGALSTKLRLALSVLLLLGCKNVSLKPNDNDPNQVKRAIKRHGGTPDSYRYHTLVVRPPGAKSDSPAQDIGIMPRHVCRGHFSEYGPEFNKGLLFGKYSRRFYIPPHLKGDKKNGVVEKDYLASTPPLGGVQ